MHKKHQTLLGYHPDYGLDDETRLKILRDAERLSVREAAEMHRVSTRVVVMWRAAAPACSFTPRGERHD